MLIPDGDFRYEIRRAGELIATEEEILAWGKIRGVRHPASGSNVYEVEAELDSDGLVRLVVVRYSRGPFVRNATYESADNFLRGNISAMGGRQNLTTKLGRYREVDADLVIFRALTIAHIRARGQSRWTGRMAAIDPNTLVAATSKQTCRRAPTTPMSGSTNREWATPKKSRSTMPESCCAARCRGSCETSRRRLPL